jgi:hypothetical protein
MLRFIICNKWRDGHSGAEGERLITLDVDVPELHDALTVGGYSEHSYDIAQLIGVEILPQPEKGE